ncbi:Phosphoglucomutase/phosphomannomutase alpha/beta/alpha domain I [Gracilaria domingensis]|nr:Phosphoglucomutase/phosphomannomutase alpha/beta/alpha domain I [Gracilaria domingensis]
MMIFPNPNLKLTALSDLDSLLGHRHHPAYLAYGTAGFRGLATNLYEAVLRCGVLAACRSHVLGGKAVGVMVTASHNPPADNGLKLVEPDGSMLDPEWEQLATEFVNASHQPARTLQKFVSVGDVAIARKATVVVGRDTRESSATLVDLIVQGVEAVGGRVMHVGLVTTPQLHFSVRARHCGEPCNILHYYENMKKAYAQLTGNKSFSASVALDCANGVGATAVKCLKGLLPNLFAVNKPGDGPLNHECGADFVQKKRRPPVLYSQQACQADIWASLDGDADRLVMYRNSEHGFVLADGDRFAALLATFVSKHITATGISALTVGVAQTAYSNGAATQYLDTLSGVDIVVAKTGVKHLEKAVRSYDIGIYWEPNGHGTVLFSEKAICELQKAANSSVDIVGNSHQQDSVSTLLAISRLANQAVGDGVADLLLVCGILCKEDMSFESWLRQYDERCSSNMVVRVQDKNVILTEDCDRSVKEPEALRETQSQRLHLEKGVEASLDPVARKMWFEYMLRHRLAARNWRKTWL